MQASDVDAALEEVIAKIAETLDGDTQAAKQQTDNAAKPAETKAPAATAASAATQAKKSQPAPAPKKKGFFARLFGR